MIHAKTCTRTLTARVSKMASELMKLMLAVALSASLSLGATQAFGNSPGQCHLNNPSIQHIVYIQFDNVHLERDNSNVPSDLEQMPNLLNFL
ncbi:MAG TPA: hypothetical protein VJQ47_16790, partial [Steroidobacteraceae bacterium]|nr:hypothetical protein [Steroidobacteraceae bacterium]